MSRQRVVPGRVAVVTAGLLTMAVLAGCGSSADDEAAPSSPRTTISAPASASESPKPSATPAPATHGAAIAAARRTLVAYLDTRREDGPALAAQRYLVPEEEKSDAAWTGPRLLRGTVGATSQITSWESAGRFTFSADLDLHFAGDPIAWTEGVNTRFVTAERAPGSTGYRLAFATSP